ncbi:MAG: hypothetical protein NWE94_02080 [Candidatus Bathyarchaeota archaeon]|nr:hypothetical protein [Candidatus Bathyarchaeota archaeon]
MPEEYINYTISDIDGNLWAIIDGVYPLHVPFWSGSLPLLYPTPPGTKNISISIDETPLKWSNFTEIYPEALHVTPIGNWTMINCTIASVPEHFTLKIHYEHPVVLINGSYGFLYDLNISPYLSPSSLKSTAHFTVHMDINYTSFHVNAIAPDKTVTPINFTVTRADSTKMITFEIISEYSKPLLGDVLMTFDTSQPTSAVEFSYILVIMPVVVILTLIARMAYKRKHSDMQSKTK